MPQSYNPLIDLLNPSSTLEWLKDQADTIKALSLSEVGNALNKAVLLPEPKRFFDMLHDADLLDTVAPRLVEAKKTEQNKKGGVQNVYDHSLLALEHAVSSDPIVRWAALYHDLGKCATRKVINGKVRFFGHEKISAKWALKDLQRWGFDFEFAKDVAHLILHHMFDSGPQLTDDAVKKLIKRVGPKYIFQLLNLRLADSAGFVGKPTGSWKINLLRSRVEKELSKNPFLHSGLCITDKTLIQRYEISQEESKVVMDLLLNMVVFDKIKNRPVDLLNFSDQIMKLRGFCPLGFVHLIHQHSNRIEGLAEENADGTLSCGKHCEFKCDRGDLWTY